jgi:Protein of unknown function (DUF1073)
MLSWFSKNRASQINEVQRPRFDLSNCGTDLKPKNIAGKVLANQARLTRSQYQSQSELQQTLSKIKFESQLTWEQIDWMYRNHPLARRICSEFADHSWINAPLVLEKENVTGMPTTAFEKACDEIAKKVDLYAKFKQLDILACKGQYAVLYIDYADERGAQKINYNTLSSNNGASADYYQKLGVVNWESLKNKGAEAINSVVSFDQGVAWPKIVNTDTKSPIPPEIEYYILQTGGINSHSLTINTGNLSTKQFETHRSRCLHAIKHADTNNYYGISMLEPVYNYLKVIMSLVGSSAVIFELNARGGLALSLKNDTRSLDQASLDKFKDAASEYVEGYRRFLLCEGLDAKVLNHTSHSPVEPFDVAMKLIAAHTKIPIRILLGNEAGNLASEEDSANLQLTTQSYQTGFCSPMVRSFFQPLIDNQVIPAPSSGEFKVEWPSNTKLDKQAQSEVFNAIAQGVSALGRAPAGEVENSIDEFIDVGKKILDMGQ